MKQIATCLLVAAAVVTTANAVKFELRGRPGPSRRLQRRAGSVSMQNTANTEYSMNVSLGGLPFDVIVDAGRWAYGSCGASSLLADLACSSDLYVVAQSIPGANDLGVQGGVSYVGGSVAGESWPTIRPACK